MKVLLIEGCRKGGNTDAVASQFVKGAEEAGHEVTREYLFTKKMNGCLGCQHCRNTDGICVWKDDLVQVNEEILASDVLVFVSPVYFYGITAQLKMAMDRTFNIEERVHDKKVFFITSAAAPLGEEYEKKLQYAIDTVQGWVDCYRDNVCLEKVFAAWNMWGEPDITKHEAYQEAYEAGRNL